MPDLHVTFPAAEHHCPLTGTKLHCLAAEAHVCKQLAQGCYLKAQKLELNPRPLATNGQINTGIQSSASTALQCWKHTTYTSFARPVTKKQMNIMFTCLTSNCQVLHSASCEHRLKPTSDLTGHSLQYYTEQLEPAGSPSDRQHCDLHEEARLHSRHQLSPAVSTHGWNNLQVI